MLISWLLQVEEHVRTTWARDAEEVRIGPLSAFFRADDPTYGVAAPREPLDDPDEATPSLEALRKVFRERGVRLRVEMGEGPHAAWSAELVRQGLVPDEETPILVLPRERFELPRPDPEVQVRLAGERDDMAFVASMLRQGFEVRGAVGEADVAAVRAALAAGVRIAVAKIGGAPAGTGFATPAAGVTEIATVSTLPSMRRRGVARQVIAALCAAHFDAGGTLAWACAPDAAAYALLGRVGFLDAGLRRSFKEP